MQRKLFSLVLTALMVMLSLVPAQSVAQQSPQNWDACRLGAFSTEEDFQMQDSEPYDGNPYISDGDVLSLDGEVCARNRDLLSPFFAAAAPPDLGLDALDILNVTDRIVAFSTELDDPGKRFTAGDLLFTNGGDIPNVALVAAFKINYDIGLDAVQFMGPGDKILAFVASLPNLPRDRFLENPDLLRNLLLEHGIDLWFSIEGTHRNPDQLTILDGDLLSAAFGTIVAANSALLPGNVPAGIPTRGVDFGLDAVVVSDRTLNRESALKETAFSTEILFESDKASFTDGDILRFQDGVLTPNELLIAKFHAAADFLGLDALSGAQPQTEPEPMITLIGNRSVWDIDGGFVTIGGGGTGLYWDGLSTTGPTPPRRPFGWYIPIDGYLTDDIVEFRVAFRETSAAPPTPGTSSAIQTSWRIREWYGTPPFCRPTGTFAPDGDGWFNAADYRFYQSGSGGCPNGGLVLAVWDTLNDPNVLDKDGHYVLWLEWRTTLGGTVFREPVDHHVQLDNTAPKIDAFELRTAGGTTVPACGGASAGTDVFEVYADFSDAYLLGYRIRLRGGNPPASAYYPSPGGWHGYWEGAPYAANLNGQGTTPAGLQLLREIDMNDLGGSYVECCYVLDLWVSDAAIRHNFNRYYAYPDQPGWAWPNVFLTFAAAP
ncbi:hypothetical protein GC175_14365 [bacterium]|nr:hypothetical protein [bacterium]